MAVPRRLDRYRLSRLRIQDRTRSFGGPCIYPCHPPHPLRVRAAIRRGRTTGGRRTTGRREGRARDTAASLHRDGDARWTGPHRASPDRAGLRVSLGRRVPGARRGRRCGSGRVGGRPPSARPARTRRVHRPRPARCGRRGRGVSRGRNSRGDGDRGPPGHGVRGRPDPRHRRE